MRRDLSRADEAVRQGLRDGAYTAAGSTITVYGTYGEEDLTAFEHVPGVGTVADGEYIFDITAGDDLVDLNYIPTAPDGTVYEGTKWHPLAEPEEVVEESAAPEAPAEEPAEAPVEEAPVEEPAEAPAEEAPVEEAPAEEKSSAAPLIISVVVIAAIVVAAVVIVKKKKK